MTVRRLQRRAFALLFVGVLAAGCGDHAAPARAGQLAQPIAVHLVAPQQIELPDTVAVTGMLAPREELVLGFQVAGRLAQLDVDVGDAVPAGAVVAALDPVDFQLGIARARAALTSARARLGLPAEEGQERSWARKT